ncbi:MAG: hypothetical protein V3V00_13925 [Saprospiraceae bacterium]
MAKDKNRGYKKKPKGNNKTEQSTYKAKKTNKRFAYWRLLVNIGYLVFSGILFYCMITYNPGYDWLFNSLIKNTYKSKEQVLTITTDQKLESKLGFDAKYLLFLKSKTPEEAIILMPPPEIITRKRDGGLFSNDSAYAGNLYWASYFVYPRKLVYEGNESIYSDQITHVAIINKWGYQYAPNVPEDQHQEYSVINL